MKNIFILITLCLGLFASDEIEINKLNRINYKMPDYHKLILTIEGDITGVNAQTINYPLNDNCTLSFSVRSRDFDEVSHRLYPEDATIICKNNVYSADIYDIDTKKGILFEKEYGKYKRELKQLDYIANNEKVVIEYPYKPKQLTINGVKITIVVVNPISEPVMIFEGMLHTASVRYVKESRIVTLNSDIKITKSGNVKEIQEQLLNQMNKLNPSVEIKRNYLEYLVNSDESWKKELNVKNGINNILSKDTKKYFCENSNISYLNTDILNALKYQDPIYYQEHKDLVDKLPEKLINSTLKENQNCPKDYIVTGSCGDWKCSKQPTQDEMTKYINGHCFDLEKEKNETDTIYGERIKSCLTVQYLKTTKDTLQKEQKMLKPETTSGVEK